MSQENVETVRRMYEDGEAAYYGRTEEPHESIASSNFAEFKASTWEMNHPNFVHSAAEDSPFPEAGRGGWRGRGEFLRFVAGHAESSEPMSLEPEEFIDAGD